jgi:hypothetical protein
LNKAARSVRNAPLLFLGVCVGLGSSVVKKHEREYEKKPSQLSLERFSVQPDHLAATPDFPAPLRANEFAQTAFLVAREA